MTEQATAELRCKGCGQPLVLCPMCTGSDSSDDAGRAQGGYYLCDDPDCPEYEVCCGC